MSEPHFDVVIPTSGRPSLRRLVDALRDEGVERVVAHAPLDRPGSGRVLEKAGFRAGPEREEEHDGTLMRVRRWELAL